jgi:hypothetical protein
MTTVPTDMNQTLATFIAGLTTSSIPADYISLNNVFGWVILTTTVAGKSTFTLQKFPANISTFTLKQIMTVINYSLNTFTTDTLDNFIGLLNSPLGSLYACIDKYNVAPVPITPTHNSIEPNTMYGFTNDNLNLGIMNSSPHYSPKDILGLIGYNGLAIIGTIEFNLVQQGLLQVNSVEFNAFASAITSQSKELAFLRASIATLTATATAAATAAAAAALDNVNNQSSNTLLPPPFQNSFYLGNAMTISGLVMDCRGNNLSNIGDAVKPRDAVNLKQLRAAFADFASSTSASSSSSATSTGFAKEEDLIALSKLLDIVCMNCFGTTASNVLPIIH